VIPVPVVIAWKAIWRYRKIAGVVILGLALALISWRIASWRTGYLKHAAAVTALHKEQAGRELDRKTYLENSIKAEKEAQALAADLADIRERFAKLQQQSPIVTIKRVEVPIAPGQTSCPEPRVSPDFLRMWNDAGKP